MGQLRLPALLSLVFGVALLVVVLVRSNDAPAAPAAPAVAPGSAGVIAPGATMPADHPPVGDMPAAMPIPSENAPVAKVVETMSSAGYTYALLEMEGDSMWAAGPVTELAVGDEVSVVSSMGMRDFYASSLDRTFETILFVQGFPKYVR